MKKKVISLFVTGMLAVSMIAGCGSDNTADTSTSADTTADASTDAAADTTAEEAPAATTDFDASEYVNVLSREDGSGTRGAFIELFGIEEKDADGNKVDNTTEEAIITNSTSVMLTSVASDEYAIGYVSLGSLDDTVKAVSIDGAVATVENIKNGTCLLYTSDAADEEDSVDLGGCRRIKKKKKNDIVCRLMHEDIRPIGATITN